MNLLTNCLVLIGVPAGLIVAGYWLAVRLDGTGPAERLAAAVLAGLALLIWNVSVLGLFLPTAGAGAWMCLWPVVPGLLVRRARDGLLRDVSGVLFSRRGTIAALSAGIFLLALLWPLLTQHGLLFYDGTSNHDAFFWISGAEYLRGHTYLAGPVRSAVQPFTNIVGAFAGGWTPEWGRMGSEGLLAFLSAVSGHSPLLIYVAATAALFVPWVAATYLAARTFLIGRPSPFALIALCGVQPLFVYFHANANLPNLLGVLTGALVVVAMQRSLRPGPARFWWLLLLALGLHGLLCSYPEMVPFVLLPAGLLWVRGSVSPGRDAGWCPVWAPVLAGLAGLALNPVTTVRACSGFLHSFAAGRTDENWANVFRPLATADYAPALATMSLHTSDDLGITVAALCSLLLIGVLLAVVSRAHDRFGALMLLAGAGLLLAYTAAAHFGYGWQKTAQFGGVFSAAMLPVAAIDLFSRPTSDRFRVLARLVLAALGAFFLYATTRNCFESYKWSQRKAITQDWLAIRDYAHGHLAGAPVLIDAPSFRWPFFHGMWAVYFLADSHPIFPDRGRDNGGYLRDYTRTENQAPGEAPQAFLVSAPWAASFDANSPRLVSGETVVLLGRENRVDALRGLLPQTGVPETASSHLMLELRPHSPSRLLLELAPSPGTGAAATRWHVTREADQTPSYSAEVSGSPPWRFVVPLAAGRTNRIELNAADAPSDPAFPFAVTGLQIRTDP